MDHVKFTDEAVATIIRSPQPKPDSPVPPESVTEPGPVGAVEEQEFEGPPDSLEAAVLSASSDR